MFAMPNVIPQNPIEIDGIAFVADFDDRIKALRQKYPNCDDYLNRFTNEFGRKLSTGTIMVGDDVPVLPPFEKPLPSEGRCQVRGCEN
jgi:hypothetical protein